MWVKIRELLAIITVLLILVGLPFAVRYYHQKMILENYGSDVQVFDLYASATGGKWITEPVNGTNYWWKNFQNCDTLKVELGKPVVFRITSTDVLHSFAIPSIRELRKPIDIEPGRWHEVSFMPEEEDVFSFLCWQFCSDHHESMHGEISVVDAPQRNFDQKSIK
ncbi:MAG: hypothetical protein GWN62_15525 [Aliifodinibius sp.]|nr:hypothetical protein [candidate division KSB1 bacterium]NIV12632.1 hypothetical protein [Fodinibius sp.]NIR71624.1 hypothetical protein [candidate division KSB1 bacterium]NIS24852.1 hypothetical protein [candidate division KSB1 bacterium]NIU25492.1 hypothetical protein [candidate division KSB1 bacterium]